MDAVATVALGRGSETERMAMLQNILESQKEAVRYYRDNPDVRRIIQSWLRKKTKDELIKY